jgi:hypothetical protein
MSAMRCRKNVSDALSARIYPSTRIGYQGNRRWSTTEDICVHLHFAISTNSSYTGAIDPTPYYGIQLNGENPNSVGWMYYKEYNAATPPAQPTFTSAYAMGPNTIRLQWSTSPDPDSFSIYNRTNGQTRSVVGGARWDYFLDLQCNKEYLSGFKTS